MNYNIAILFAVLSVCGLSDAGKQICTPAQVFERGCNTCECAQDGMTWECSNQKCFPDDDCVDGELWKEDCNACTCRHGTVFCTDLGCSERPKRVHLMTPCSAIRIGKAFQDPMPGSCNICHCDAEDYMMCDDINVKCKFKRMFGGRKDMTKK